MKPLKIEIVHDVVCSWCPIGYANLTQALRNLSVEADVFFLPHELNPDMGNEGEPIEHHLERRYGWDNQRQQQYREHLLEVASAADVSIDFSRRTHYYNTQYAHRLMHWAETFGKQKVMNELLIDAYFDKGLNVGDVNILSFLAEILGLDRADTKKAIESSEVETAVRRKKERLKHFEVTSVPAFIFNDTTLITGSNSVSFFESCIRNFIADAEPLYSDDTNLHQ